MATHTATHTEVRGYERDAECKVADGGASTAEKPFTCAPGP